MVKVFLGCILVSWFYPRCSCTLFFGLNSQGICLKCKLNSIRLPCTCFKVSMVAHPKETEMCHPKKKVSFDLLEALNVKSGGVCTVLHRAELNFLKTPPRAPEPNSTAQNFPQKKGVWRKDECVYCRIRISEAMEFISFSIFYPHIVFRTTSLCL